MKKTITLAGLLVLGLITWKAQAANNDHVSTVVNTDVQQTLIIPLANNSGNGGYYLTLDNANGFAEGDFNRNDN